MQMETPHKLEEEVIKRIRLAIGSEITDSEIYYALKQFGDDVDAAIDYMLHNSLDVVKRTGTSTGFRVSTRVKEEPIECEAVVKVKEERIEPEGLVKVKEAPKEGEGVVRVKEEPLDMELGSGKVLVEKVVKLESGIGVEEQPSVEAIVSQETAIKEDEMTLMEEYSNQEVKMTVKEEKLIIEDVVNQETEMEVEETPVVKENASQEAVTRVKVEKPIIKDVVNQEKKMEVEGKPLVEESTNQEAAAAVKEEDAMIEDVANQETRMEVEEKLIVEEHTNQKSPTTVKEEKPTIVDVEETSSMKEKINEEPVIILEEVATHDPKLVGKKESRKFPESVKEFLAYRNRAKAEKKAKEEKENVDVKKENLESVRPSGVEDGDFAEDPDWYLVGGSVVTGLSTTKGRKLVDNEIVHFVFPTNYDIYRYRPLNPQWIVRFSTKRFGEIGRLPMEWGKCVVPLVHSNKVRIFGRCVAAPPVLHMMQEIMVYVSFYIHRSLFTVSENSTWKLDAPANIDSTVNPLLTLFKLLKIIPYQQAEFTPEELASRKRSLNLEGNADDGTGASLPLLKRAKGCQVQQHKDEQAISEASLNKLVGAVDTYNLEEMEPPATLMCDLRPYQKQALFWMSECEKGVDAENAAKTLHPCWAAYKICDERASSIYLNIFSGEAATKFPTAMETARGGILADAMGLGKTVMTIALILARRGKGSSDIQLNTTHKNDPNAKVQPKPKGGTLIVCPMALLGQWKDELETHSKPESISVFVHYGGDRTNDPRALSGHDVVLTTYGVLTAAYKSDKEYSIYHRVDWHRVVLDEAHTIKSWKTMGAQAAFTLTAHCRWCLTGTPLQNNLEDLYSLLCFLHVEPWCNWPWWSKLIQRPYENGDERGLKLIKAILRPLMLRRTKETKDKEGRPILVLPPPDIRVIECEQSEAEHDFYDALFKRSKVQFDQFVAQGKVLHNYANILELLLRLRQCCNHPFLVMSRADSQYSDLNNFARKFMEANADSSASGQKGQSRAYIEEVVEDIRRGENTECPICMESADDPILTPCAHRMCRECILSSWRTPTTGLCPICRILLKKTDLVTCPTDNKFRIDVEKNWKESSKVSKLLECLERTRRSGSGEKSIVFSQWTSFLDLLEIPLKRREIGFLRFDGKLAQKNREKVLKEFNETNEKMVLLMSLKAGGVGLNLTAASNVYLMDPWWNPAVEEQAIMRIHRIGQKRTVRVRRFIVKDTVEERMQQVQAKKQRMIAGALTDEEVRSARLEELKMLFR